MNKHRAILLTENDKIIIRNDNNNMNGKLSLENDIFNFLNLLDEKNMINIKNIEKMIHKRLNPKITFDDMLMMNRR